MRIYEIIKSATENSLPEKKNTHNIWFIDQREEGNSKMLHKKKKKTLAAG